MTANVPQRLSSDVHLGSMKCLLWRSRTRADIHESGQADFKPHAGAILKFSISPCISRSLDNE